jgi:hypothetical protein
VSGPAPLECVSSHPGLAPATRHNSLFYVPGFMDTRGISTIYNSYGFRTGPSSTADAGAPRLARLIARRGPSPVAPPLHTGYDNSQEGRPVGDESAGAIPNGFGVTAPARTRRRSLELAVEAPARPGEAMHF